MADVNGTFFRYDSVVPNATVDWRLTKYISPIQRQFQCASCWVIAAVDSISMMWAITNRSTPLVLSPQQVCDCATKQCCQGGWPDWAYSYVLFNGGLQSVDDYSYIAQDNQLCSINASVPNAAQITGWELVPPYNAMALMKAVSMQPVVAFLSGSSKDFQTFAGNAGFTQFRPCTRCTTPSVLSPSRFPTAQGYAIGAASDGTQTCVGVATTSTSTITYTTVPGDSCSVVAAAFGITTTTLSLLNPFLNCSLLYIPPGFAITVSNTSTSSSPICTATYIVTPADNCTSLANTFFAGSLANLQRANPLVCTTGRPVYPSQAICTSVTTAGTSVTVPQCGQTYSSVAGDTCSSVATKYLISLATFTGLNPGLSCTGSLPIGSYLCVASKTVQTTVNCTATYTVLQGDNCPNIWNAANLTEQTFLAINPGIRCQAPYLQVGQKVCISSPILTTLVASSNTSYSLYKVKDGDTLALISSSFVNRCIPASVSPASIAAENNILETAALVVGMNLIIPCDSRVGIIDCGCAISLPVCGADYVTYPSYCDALVLE
ncbi:unnamed protein product [Closterium sp. Naga37s-1]|nr:unnamed protein product [Closterium sp. Naga37s-1]